MRDFQELFSKQMTRKEFLKLFAVALISILGINNFITNLDKYSKRNTIGQTSGANSKTSRGFGSRKFGV